MLLYGQSYAKWPSLKYLGNISLTMMPLNNSTLKA